MGRMSASNSVNEYMNQRISSAFLFHPQVSRILVPFKGYARMCQMISISMNLLHFAYIISSVLLLAKTIQGKQCVPELCGSQLVSCRTQDCMDESYLSSGIVNKRSIMPRGLQALFNRLDNPKGNRIMGSRLRRLQPSEFLGKRSHSNIDPWESELKRSNEFLGKRVPYLSASPSDMSEADWYNERNRRAPRDKIYGNEFLGKRSDAKTNSPIQEENYFEDTE